MNETEFRGTAPAWPSVEITQKVFDYNSSTMDGYFGYPPTEAIDDKWDALLECEFSCLSSSKADE